MTEVFFLCFSLLFLFLSFVDFFQACWGATQQLRALEEKHYKAIVTKYPTASAPATPATTLAYYLGMYTDCPKPTMTSSSLVQRCSCCFLQGQQASFWSLACQVCSLASKGPQQSPYAVISQRLSRLCWPRCATILSNGCLATARKDPVLGDVRIEPLK